MIVADFRISIIAICVANPSKPELGFDYQGILIGILSLLTTVLLAFVGGSYFLQIKMINKKIEDISNENNHAIAESMFYEGYRGMTNTSVDYDKFITSLKTSVAAINLHFSEEKAELIYEVIKDLTSRFLREYEAWLRQDRYITVRQNKTAKQAYKTIKKPALNDTGVHSYMGIIQSVFNAALLHFNDYEKGDIIITNDPFKVYTIPAVLEAKKRAVDVDIIRKIYKYSPVNKRKRTTMFTRDIYILSFLLAGMNAVDMLNCKMVNGRIEYERQKTKDRRKDNAFISVYVHPLALPIIDKYRDPSEQHLFDFYKRYSNVRNLTKGIHRGMRSLCDELGIDYIQFYSARHSFATIARNECNISKDDISLCLNHSSGKTVTDTYIKQDFSRIDKVINKVVEYVFGDTRL